MATGVSLKNEKKSKLFDQLSVNSVRATKRSTCPIQPSNIPSTCGANASLGDANQVLPSYMTCASLILVFKWLTPAELADCALVCKDWLNVSLSPSLWKKIDMSNTRTSPHFLANIVKKQPESLILNRTAISKNQLEWLTAKIPLLRELSLQGCTRNGVIALRSGNCLSLTTLDLSFIVDMNDVTVREILLPKNTRSGFPRNLHTLKLSGCPITDISVHYIALHIPLLSVLDLSQCSELTDDGIAKLVTPPATTVKTLSWLDLSGCSKITNGALTKLEKLERLTYVDLRHTAMISESDIQKFLEAKYFVVVQEKLLVKPTAYD